MSRLVALAGIGLALGCAPHEDEAAPPIEATPAPVVVAEPALALVLPAVVAPALPELAPTRPLANLRPLWHTPDDDGPPPATVWPVGLAPVAMSAVDAASLGLSGQPTDPSALGIVDEWPLQFAGPLLLVRSRTEFVALDSGTNELVWLVPEQDEARYFEAFVAPRVAVTQTYGSEVDGLVAWALEDGRQLWRRLGADDPSVSRIKRLWTDDGRGYLLGEAGLVAFDVDTGATLWTHALAESDCGAVTGDGVVIVEARAAYVVLAADTGVEIDQIARPGQDCKWESYAYDAPPVIDQGRLYMFELPSDGSEPPLRAIDLETQAELWKVEGVASTSLAVDHDAVFVTREDAEILVALDADTGQVVTEVSVGAPFWLRVEPVGGAAGPWVVLEEDEGRQWVLGRGQTPTPLESYEIRGQLVATEGAPRKRVAGIQIRVGRERVKTDKRGRFVARGEARGAVTVQRTPQLEEYDDGRDEWTEMAVDPQRVFLVGEGRYDLGELPAYEISME